MPALTRGIWVGEDAVLGLGWCLGLGLCLLVGEQRVLILDSQLTRALRGLARVPVQKVVEVRVGDTPREGSVLHTVGRVEVVEGGHAVDPGFPSLAPALLR